MLRTRLLRCGLAHRSRDWSTSCAGGGARTIVKELILSCSSARFCEEVFIGSCELYEENQTTLI